MTVEIIVGDCRDVLKTMPDESVHCVITSPPYYGLRDYGESDQIGLEETPESYIAEMVAVFREVRRVLRDDGTVWLNLGDSYATGTKAERQPSTGVLKHHVSQDIRRIGTPIGFKTKDLMGIPWRVALALQADGWWLRQDIIWHKPNPMPESVTDRCTKAHEYIFLLSKSAQYYYDNEAIKEDSIYPDDDKKSRSQNGQKRLPTDMVAGVRPGSQTYPTRNKRSVWTVTTKPFSEAHFATFPPDLIEPCVLAGCHESGTILDPFAGAGTTGLVADRKGRNAILIELNPEYAEMTRRRIIDDAGWFANVKVREIA